MKNKLRHVKYALLLTLLVGIVPISMIFAEAPLDIRVQLDSEPIIDVVLSLGKTNLDATNFERDLIGRLNDKGVNTSKVKVQAIETEEQDVQNTFDWNEDVSSSIGSINFSNGGSSIQMYGNRTNPGFNKIYTDNITNPDIKEQEMGFSFNLDYGDSFDAAGVLVNIHETNGSMNGYALTFPSRGNARLFQLTNWKSRDEIWIGGHSASGSINSKAREVASFNLGNGGTFKLKSTKDEIVIYKSGTEVGKANLPRHYGFGFGFFADHYSHSCSRIGQFRMDNLQLNTTMSKDFSEVIRQPEWRDGTDRYLVNFEDNIVPDFDSGSASGEILTRLINEGIHFLGVGSSANERQFKDLVSRNNDNGAFYRSDNYNRVMNSVADYIFDRIPEPDDGVGDRYVVVGEPFRLNVSPSSLLKDTATKEYPNGRWRVDHEYDYYDNDIGQATWANQWQNDLILDLDKPGKYELFFATQHPEPRYIYVHRRPLADFSLQVARTGNKYNIKVHDNSYDPDLEYSANKGITEREWKWRETTSSVWNDGEVPRELEVGNNYIVQLRVKDEQDTWSVPESRFITTDNVTVPPVASFTASPNPLSMYERLNVNDNSYDPAGKAITQREWKVDTESGRNLYTGASTPVNFQSWGEGIYRISLRIKNDANLWSERYSRMLRVTTDTEAPTAIITPARMDATQDDVEVSVKCNDSGGSGFKHQRHNISSSPTPPSSGWSSWNTSQDVKINLTEEGRHYIHLEAFDNAGNKFTRTAGDYLIDRTPPELEITQDSFEISHEDTTMLLKYSDSLSGIESVVYKTKSGLEGNITSNELTVRSNDVYTFTAKDRAGNETTKVHEVKNLDKTISFIAPQIKDFNDVQLKEDKSVVSTSIEDLVIKDWRDDNNDWRIDVEASQFLSSNGQYGLKRGSLTMNPYKTAKQTGGNVVTPNISNGDFTKPLTIDDGVQTLVSAKDTRGMYNIEFSKEALNMTIDSTESLAGSFTSVITWSLVTGP